MSTATANFRTLLGACPAWRELCGITTGTEEEKQTAAEGFIVPWGEKDPDTFPRAYVAQGSNDSTRHALGMFTESGSIVFRIFAARDTGDSFATSYSEFCDTIQSIRNEMHTVNASGGYIDLSAINITMPAPDAAANEAKFWTVDGSATYSLGAL